MGGVYIKGAAASGARSFGFAAALADAVAAGAAATAADGAAAAQNADGHGGHGGQHHGESDEESQHGGCIMKAQGPKGVDANAPSGLSGLKYSAKAGLADAVKPAPALLRRMK